MQTPGTMTMEYANQLEAEFRRAQTSATAAGERRNEAVLLLIEAGNRPSAIAHSLGLSPQRVGQIVATARHDRERTNVAA